MVGPFLSESYMHLLKYPDVPMDQPVADYLVACYQEFVSDGGAVKGVVEQILDRDEARRTTRCHSATAAYRFPAGSLWPSKLVAHLLTLCIEKHGLNLQTHTPVRSVEPRAGKGWTVKTDRGDLATEQVVYATNAFTGTLLPEFVGRIWPFRGQCAAVVPTKAYAGKNMLTHSYGLWSSASRLSSGKYPASGDYLIQRPRDGVIIFGGARWSVSVDKLLGNTDDSGRYLEMTEGLKEALPRYFEGFGEAAVGEGLVYDWSGECSLVRSEIVLLRIGSQASWATPPKARSHLFFSTIYVLTAAPISRCPICRRTARQARRLRLRRPPRARYVSFLSGTCE